MNQSFYCGYRFPANLIQRAIWMSLRHTLSYPCWRSVWRRRPALMNGMTAFKEKMVT
jgi:hypothetical protein